MNTQKKIVLSVAILIILIGISGYLTYRYLVEKPPTFLVELVTSTKAPPPLPAGEIASFLTVPDGFVATIFSRDVPGARVMTRDNKGTMIVSLTKSGKVVALPDSDGDQVADRTVTILEGLRQPHGLVVRCTDQVTCILYVAETGSLKAYQYDADTLTATYDSTLAEFPTGNGHYTRTIIEHPNGSELLASVGSSCNVCVEKEPMRATVQAIHMTTQAVRTVATGLRNTVFMAIHPVTGEVWGTDNGRDMIGDAIPPDELNIIKEDADYGWPFCYGKNVRDTSFAPRAAPQGCDGKTASTVDLPAHGAALGLAFIPEEGWPEAWAHHALIALHGSWNSSTPVGYKVIRVPVDSQGNVDREGIQDFVTGFLPSGAEEDESIGRPAGILAEPGGIAYVSDDRAGAIYRISLTEPVR